MTYCALHAQQLSLAMYVSNCNFTISSITQKRMNVAWQLQSFAATVDYNNDPKIQQLQAMDNYLELQQKTIETQVSAAQKSLESIENYLKDGVKKGHTLNLNA